MFALTGRGAAIFALRFVLKFGTMFAFPFTVWSGVSSGVWSRGRPKDPDQTSDQTLERLRRTQQVWSVTKTSLVWDQTDQMKFGPGPNIIWNNTCIIWSEVWCKVWSWIMVWSEVWSQVWSDVWSKVWSGTKHCLVWDQTLKRGQLGAPNSVDQTSKLSTKLPSKPGWGGRTKP